MYLGSKSSTLYTGLGNPALQLLFLCNLPHTFQLSGSPFPWFGLQSWILSNLHYFCFPQIDLPLSQNRKRKGGKNHKNSFHTLLTIESSFSNSSGQKERFSLRVLCIRMFAAPNRSISSLPVLYSGQGREMKREKRRGEGREISIHTPH